MVKELLAGDRLWQGFPGYERAGCRYAMFDRHLGVSKEPFASLNISFSSGDVAEAVRANRDLVRKSAGMKALLFGHQVHGDKIYQLSSELTVDREVAGYDGLITKEKGVGLVIQHADCQAVLLYDPRQQAIGAVHCGWRGSVASILTKAVGAMTEAFATRPEELLAAVSPSLGPCCAEFIHYRQELPSQFQKYMTADHYFDFWRITRDQLADSGLAPGAVVLPKICTSCSDDYFSYRRACRNSDGITGRNCSVIALF